MNLSALFSPTTAGQVNAGMRHVYTAGLTTFTILGALAIIPQDQIQPAMTALREIGDGLQQAFGGFSKLWVILGPVGAVLVGKAAVASAGFKKQLASVTAAASQPDSVEKKMEMVAATADLPKVEKIVAPDIAMAMPSPKVVTQ